MDYPQDLSPGMIEDIKAGLAQLDAHQHFSSEECRAFFSPLGKKLRQEFEASTGAKPASYKDMKKIIDAVLASGANSPPQPL